MEISIYGHEMPFTQPPSRGRVSNVPSVMMDLFHRGPHDKIAAEIVRSVTPRAVDPLQHRLPGGKMQEHLHLLTFDVPDLTPGETLHSAQLRLTLAFLDWNLRPTKDVESTVKVYWGSDEAMLSHQVQDNGLEKNVNFNCTDVIERFLRLQRFQGGELQLMVGVTLSSELRVHPLVAGNNVDNQPLLLLLYSSVESTMNTSVISNFTNRRKRDLEVEEYEEESNQVWPGNLALSPKTKISMKKPRSFCRRRPLYIQFSDINYDTWIVAPNGYQAFQCVGKCTYPLSDHLSPTKHAIIQTLLHSLHPSKAPRPCCVPTKLDSISVLYLDSQGVLTYRLSYKDMVVAECGCR